MVLGLTKAHHPNANIPAPYVHGISWWQWTSRPRERRQGHEFLRSVSRMARASRDAWLWASSTTPRVLPRILGGQMCRSILNQRLHFLTQSRVSYLTLCRCECSERWKTTWRLYAIAAPSVVSCDNCVICTLRGFCCLGAKSPRLLKKPIVGRQHDSWVA
jgi:hypothetical protein